MHSLSAHQKEMLFIELRGFYQKEDLARFFAPILGTDNDFKENVLRIYPQVETAQELIDRLNMSPSAFKRKFRETFGISARQWLIRKKNKINQGHFDDQYIHSRTR